MNINHLDIISKIIEKAPISFKKKEENNVLEMLQYKVINILKEKLENKIEYRQELSTLENGEKIYNHSLSFYSTLKNGKMFLVSIDFERRKLNRIFISSYEMNTWNYSHKDKSISYKDEKTSVNITKNKTPEITYRTPDNDVLSFDLHNTDMFEILQLTYDYDTKKLKKDIEDMQSYIFPKKIHFDLDTIIENGQILIKPINIKIK